MTYSTFLKSSFSEPTNNNFEGYLLYHGFEKVFTGLKGHININRQMGYRLTPLMMAIIFDRREAFCFLLANKKIVNLNAQDFRGYTSLHHAAIQSDGVAYNLLLAAEADPGIQDRYKGTPSDLYRHTHPGFKPVNPIVYEGSEISPAKWEEITHSKYTEELVIGPEVIVKIWASCDVPPVISRHNAFYESRHRQFRANPPKIGFKNIGVTGNSAYLLEPVSKGTIVAEYPGDYNPLTNNTNIYSFTHIICATHRGVSSLIQDGTPNLLSRAFTAKGVREITIFIATRDIKAGESLYFCYGPRHKVKQGPYLPFEGEALRKWLKGVDLDQLAEKFKTGCGDPAQSGELFDYGNLNYIRNTPPVLLALYLEGRITRDQLISLLSPQTPINVINVFKSIADQSMMDHNPRDTSYRNYILNLLENGLFKEAAAFAGAYSSHAALNDPKTPFTEDYLNLMFQILQQLKEK